MKFGTQNKSNRLIMNILLGIDDPDPKLQIGPKTKVCFNFIFMKIPDFRRFCPTFQI